MEGHQREYVDEGISDRICYSSLKNSFRLDVEQKLPSFFSLEPIFLGLFSMMSIFPKTKSSDSFILKLDYLQNSSPTWVGKLDI